MTDSNGILKASARSVNQYNIGRTVKVALDNNIILGGGGHNMAAGLTLKKERFLDFKEFIFKDYLKKCTKNITPFNYDSEVSTMAFNIDFFNDIKKLQPFGNGNPLPIFLFKDFNTKKVANTETNKRAVKSDALFLAFF